MVDPVETAAQMMFAIGNERTGRVLAWDEESNWDHRAVYRAEARRVLDAVKHIEIIQTVRSLLGALATARVADGYVLNWVAEVRFLIDREG